jgi:hypothetical protein
MRNVLALMFLSWSLSAPLALAQPMTQVSLSAEAQQKFASDYGQREIATLTASIERAIAREVARSGAPNGVRVEVTLLDAVPSRPTFQQSIDKPGLDPIRSVGVGGATLNARILGPGGEVLGTISHRYYETDLSFSQGASTWTDAQRAISGFARKVGKAVRDAT